MTQSEIDEKAHRLKKRLSELVRAPVSLVLTDNTRSMVSARRDGELIRLRIHHMFLEADEPVIRALCGILSGNGRSHHQALRTYIKRHEKKIRRVHNRPRPRRITLAPEGRFFNLQSLFDRINRKTFDNRVVCSITWGLRRKRSGRVSVRLGSYSPKSGLIRIHPILDRAFVPLYVVEDIVHHEMLHAHLGSLKKGGRNLTHHPTFKKMEKAFPLHERAKHWLNKNLKRLLAG